MPGLLPLFPLPNVLLYPGAMLPLHIFEPRYLEMMAHCRKTQTNKIVVGLLEGGWESDYFEVPKVHDVAGLGEIVHTTALKGPRLNILVRGLDRARIVEECQVETAWRQVRVDTLDEIQLDLETEPELRRRLHQGLEQLAGDDAVLDPTASTAWLVDMLLIALPIPMAEKYLLFQDLRVKQRAEGVLKLLEENSRNQRDFAVAASQSYSAPWN